MRATGERAKSETRENQEAAYRELRSRVGSGNVLALVLIGEWREALVKNPATRTCDGFDRCWRPGGHAGACLGERFIVRTYGLRRDRFFELVDEWGFRGVPANLNFCRVSHCLRPAHASPAHGSAFDIFYAGDQ